MNERLPDFLGGDSIPAVVVVTGEGELTESELADLQTLADDIAEVDGVQDGVSPPIASEDGEAVQIFVPIDTSGEVGDIVDEIRALVADELPDGMEGWVTGPAGFTADLVEGFLGIDGLLLAVALIAVFVILVIVYRSPLLPVLVLLTSMFALCVALLTVWWLAYAGIVVLNGQVQGILFILVIGAATDYALLYVARFREAIADGRAPVGCHDHGVARSRSSRSSPPAARSSRGSCACCSPTSRRTARSGPIASIGIAFSVLSALTFLPALLALVRPDGVLAVHPEGAARDDPRRPDPAREGPLAAAGALHRPARARGVDRLHRRAARRRRRHRCSSRPTACRRATSCSGTPRPATGRTCSPSTSRRDRAARSTSSCPRTTSPTAAEVLDDSDGIESVAVASDDSPTGQATVEVDGRRGRADARSGPPGAPAPEPTVSEGDVLLDRHADGCRGLGRRRGHRPRAASRPRRGARRRDGARRRRDGDRHRLERHVDPRPHASSSR